MSMFTKATKRAVKARIALDGPTGSGKTFTALQWASIFGKRIALIDSERGSASLYADRYDFDVLEMAPPYEPERLIAALEAAQSEGYDVVIIDSLSHFWEGEGGVLDMVDAAAQRAKGNSYAGWKVGTPALRHLVDTMLGLDAHLIVTMRSKMEYVLEQNERGQQVPKKVGMAPVMRQGVEYEFAVVADLDLEHRLTVSKSRCEQLADQVYPPGRSADGAETFKVWMETGEPVASRNDVDVLVQTLNRIEDPEDRKVAKKEFVDTFGRPEFLLSSRLEEARAWVNARTGTPSSSEQPERKEDEQGPETDPAASAEAGAGASAKATPPASSPDTPSWCKDLHVYAGKVAKAAKLDDADQLLDLVVYNVTGARTTSTKEINQREAAKVNAGLRDVEEGRTPVDVDGNRYRLVSKDGEPVGLPVAS